MSGDPKFLVVDGYFKKARDELAAGGAIVAGDLYAAMLQKLSPGAVCDILYPADADCELPKGATLDGYDGIAWTGCSLTVFDDIPEVRAQVDFARACYEAGVPAFGSCWAAQIAVVAAGGKCAKNPKGREMGIARKIQLTPEGRAHPLYDGKADVFDGFISHDDEITELPACATRLAGNNFTHVQAVSVDYAKGKFWGLQYHPEYDLHEMARLTWCRIDKMMRLGFFPDREAGEAHVDMLEALHNDPKNKPIAWKLGIDEDVMDESIRQVEVRNWIKHLVLPTMKERR
ncbi:MAG: type 1 glutamine amidotransferase [Rhodospirillales bacterium]|nr:type 1 glutamine amidotransferase [Rhodospirillales bacterium]